MYTHKEIVGLTQTEIVGHTQTRKIVGRTQTDKEIVGLDTKIVGLLIVAHMGDPQQPLITTAVRP